MSYNIHLHPKAITEFAEGFVWYEEKKEGLGLRFEEAINHDT